MEERGLGAEPSEADRGLEAKALGDFCKFSTKVTHFYAYSAKIAILK